MSSLRNQLRAGDPLEREPGLDPTELARIRQTIVNTPAPRRPGISLAAPLAAVLLCATVGSAWFVRSAQIHIAGTVNLPEAEPPRLRQVQFSTAGGTRVIWFFNPDLEVR